MNAPHYNPLAEAPLASILPPMPETRTKLRLLPALLFALLPVLAAAQPQPGTVDTTFDAQSSLNSWVNAIHVRSDGNILIAGAFSSAGYLKLLLPGGGSATGFSASTPQQINALKVQSDGKVLIAGEFNSVNGTTRKFIARLTSSGNVDTSFDSQAGPDNYIHTLALQADGKIVIGGSFTSYRGSSVPRVARLNTDGSLDSAFTPGSGANDDVYGMLVEPSGKIVIVGRFTSYDGTARNRIARLNANGTLDTGFNVGTGASATVRDLIGQADGKLVIVGDFASYNGQSAPAVARLNTGGSLDTTFTSPLAGQTLRSVALQADGKVVVGGNAVRRLNTSGSLDTTFAVAGVTTLVHSLALQADGKILLGGNFTQVAGVSRLFLARLHGGNAVAPTITAQPQSQTASIGQTATFSVTASGTQTLAYRWRKNGSFISGATSSSYSVVNVQASSAGNYDVEVSNVAGIVFSQPASLTVNTPPNISAQPVNKTAFVGQSTFFTVSVSGSSPLSFQWRKEGVSISGATSQSYFIGSVQASQAGGYSVVVSNPYGTVTSDTATLTVSSAVAPNISSQPQSRQVDVGQSVTFSVSATGSPSPSFQWRKNGTAIPGETGPSYTIGSVQPSHAGTYDVVASNIAGTATSSPALLTVGNAPLITTHPTNQTVTAGATVTLSVAASGTAPLSYQWRRDGTNLAGANSGTLVLDSVQASDSGYYSVVVTNSLGVAVSSAAAINILPPGGFPNRVLNLDGNGDFVTIPSAADLQAPDLFTIEGWFYPVANAANSHPLFINKGDGQDGASSRSYEIQWTPAEGFGATVFLGTDTYATLAATGPAGQWTHIALTYDSDKRLLCLYKNGLLAASSTNNAAGVPLTGQRIRQTTLPLVFGVIPGGPPTHATGSMDEVRIWSRVRTAEEIAGSMFCRLAGTEPGLTGYWTFDDGTASDSSGHGHHGAFSGDAATVALLGADPLHSTNQAPFITSQPQSLTVGIGDNASFAVTAVSGTNTGPFTYRWRKDGADLSGATNSTYDLTGVGTNQAGSYTVVVSNNSGSATSAPPAVLTVSTIPSGAVVTWGNNFYGQTTVPVGLNSVVAIAAGAGHTLAVKADTTVAAWGDDSFSQSTVPAGLEGVVAVSAGGNHSVALKNDGTVVAWGAGKVNTSTFPQHGQSIIPSGLNDVTAISAGNSHTVVLRSDGSVLAWGLNTSGQTDVPVAAQSGVAAISAGSVHTLALKTNGTIVAWGGNGSGQTDVPVSLSSVVAVSAGNSHSVALKSDGSVVAWGGNANGQTTVPPGLTGVKAIDAGYFHTAVLKHDGLVVAWGAGTSQTGIAPNFGQSVVPSTASGVIAISASEYHTVAILGSAPTITTTTSGNDFTLLWADTAAGYRLESSPNLSAPILWTNEPGPFQTNGGRISHSILLTAAPRFFRLAKP